MTTPNKVRLVCTYKVAAIEDAEVTIDLSGPFRLVFISKELADLVKPEDTIKLIVEYP